MKKLLSLTFVSVFLLINLWTTPQSSALRLVMLDIGQGDSILIRTPRGLTILIDAGPDNSVLNQLGQALPWWQRRIDYVIMTHADSDHAAGLLGLLAKYEVGEFWYNGEQADNKIFPILMEELQQRQAAVKIIKAGDSFTWPEGLRLDFIWPTAKANWRASSRNVRALVARLSWGEEDVLLTADIDLSVEQELLSQGQVQPTEILKVAHHGSRYGSGSDFLAALRPEVCLISAGLDNKFGHPTAEALQRLEAAGCQTYATLGQGQLELRLTSSSWQVLDR